MGKNKVCNTSIPDDIVKGDEDNPHAINHIVKR